LHLGSIRTALFCWLYARHHNGEFVLRIEDTDRERSTRENVQAILEGLEWLGLDADEGPFFQSERMERYRSVIDEWLADGKAYFCYCSKEDIDALREQQMARGERVRYDGRCRHRSCPVDDVTPVVRFKNPVDGEVVVNDLVRGRVTFDNAQLDDLIIARSDGSPTYNFTVIIDNYDMRISHVIRGDDHLNNTPRQMNMLAALGAEPPQYAHLPMILGADGAKLSKRHGAVDIREYEDSGYLREALLNYLVRLGWSSGDQEIFTIDEMIDLFDIADVNQSASSFNPEKLLWLNQQHIIRMPSQELGAHLVVFLKKLGIDPDDGPAPEDVAEGFRERADTLVMMAESSRYCYEDFDEIEAKAAKKHLRPAVLEPMKAICAELSALSNWQQEDIHAAVTRVADKYDIGLGKLGQPMRVAVTGGPVSPPIDVTVFLVGRDRAVARLNHAIDLIEARAASGRQ
jgi:glutamyl-tRNA synthetase